MTLKMWLYYKANSILYEIILIHLNKFLYNNTLFNNSLSNYEKLGAWVMICGKFNDKFQSSPFFFNILY
jgi:hypothetical protein